MPGIPTEMLRSVFEGFKKDPESHLTVRMRRERARQLRELLADPAAVDIATFNREVWVHDSDTYLDEDGARKKLANTSLEELTAGFEAGNVKFHGNHIWGSGTKVYGPGLKISGTKKLANIGRALRILNDPSLSVIQKAPRIIDIPGFGDNIATGLVMVFHPNDFAIYNKRSKGGTEKLGHTTHTLEEFQEVVRRLRNDLGAEDFLELDWFLYQIDRGTIEWPPNDPGPIKERRELNTILYGPPGTGKTYSVQRRALDILGSELAGVDAPDAEIGEAFRGYVDKGRIEFVTFHPSYSYEEFVEGFRYDPELQVPMLHKGLFQAFADNAANPHQDLAPIEGARIWKVSLGGSSESWVFERCMANNEISVGWLKGKDLTDTDSVGIAELFKEDHPGANHKATNYLVNEIRVGDYVAIFGSVRTIRAIGLVTGEYRYKGEEYDHHHHTRPVRWLDEQEHDIVEMNENITLTLQTIYELWRMPLQKFVGLLPEPSGSSTSSLEEPYVLVIDEINRGNISRIFGELITLLEPDKRRGAPNELSLRLPYSGRTFTVPSNLHVIGTMNTADRSIALLDVALRRRFEFEEMMPDVGVIKKVLGEKANDGFSDLTSEQADLICEVFERMNARIRALLDRDHQLGHGYFLDATSMDRLHEVFYRRVLPLLQEYFYNDRERLERMLGAYKQAEGMGFVERSKEEYGVGFSLDEGDEVPWEYHVYDVGELEQALRKTFVDA